MVKFSSFFKGIAITIALCFMVYGIYSLSSFNTNDERIVEAAVVPLQQIDLGELAFLEVIPDVALYETVYETTTSPVNFSSATASPLLSNIKKVIEQPVTPKATAPSQNEVKSDEKLQAQAAKMIVEKSPSEADQISALQMVSQPAAELSENTASKASTKNNMALVELPKHGFLLETFDLNQYEIKAGKIRKGQVIGKILNKSNVDHQQIMKLSKKSKKVHDVRDINYGKRYMVLTSKNADDVADYFIYEPDNYNYVVYDLGGETEVTEVKRTVEKRLAKASGEIKTSLYKTMVDNNLNPELAFQISEVYAWTVDFYRINSGDKFKVIYEEVFINGESVGVGAIKAAWFEYEDIGYYSFQYQQDNLFDYYDNDGNSLRKQFLKAPLRFNRISSRFTRKRYHPVLKRNKSHLGTDYAAPTGTPIHSVGDGKVVEAKYGKYNGRYVKIRHNGIYSTQYLHMSKIEPGIKIGAKVKQGDVIGYVGSTGLASGPHLCFRFWKNGRQVDPFKQALPPSKPVEEANKSDYLTVVNKWKPLLDEMLINGEPIANNKGVGGKNAAQSLN